MKSLSGNKLLLKGEAVESGVIRLCWVPPAEFLTCLLVSGAVIF